MGSKTRAKEKRPAAGDTVTVDKALVYLISLQHLAHEIFHRYDQGDRDEDE